MYEYSRILTDLEISRNSLCLVDSEIGNILISSFALNNKGLKTLHLTRMQFICSLSVSEQSRLTMEQTISVLNQRSPISPNFLTFTFVLRRSQVRMF